MKYRSWLVVLAFAASSGSVVVACGSSTSGTGADGGVHDGGGGDREDGGSRPDRGSKRDASTDRGAHEDGPAPSDGGEGGANPDANEAAADADAGPDAGPRCELKPRLVVHAATLETEDVPDGGPAGVSAPPLAVDTDHVYWVNDWQSNCSGPYPYEGGLDDATTPDAAVCGGYYGSIWRVPLRGGKPVEVVPAIGQIASRFVVTGGDVVFGASPTKGGIPGATAYIYSVPVTGGATTTLATTSGLTGFVATDGTNVYFNDNDGVKSVSLTGGTVTTLTTQQEFSFAPIGADLILANFDDDEIQSVPIGGGPLKTLVAGQLGPLYPVACGGAICWLNAGDIAGSDGGLPGGSGSITVYSKGVTSNIAVSPALFEPFDMVFNQNFYTIAGGLFTTLTTTPFPSGTPSTVAGGFFGGYGLATDDECVYWSDIMGGIYSLSKVATGPFTVK